jgi:hypothetical protein
MREDKAKSGYQGAASAMPAGAFANIPAYGSVLEKSIPAWRAYWN